MTPYSLPQSLKSPVSPSPSSPPADLKASPSLCPLSTLVPVVTKGQHQEENGFFPSCLESVPSWRVVWLYEETSRGIQSPPCHLPARPSIGSNGHPGHSRVSGRTQGSLQVAAWDKSSSCSRGRDEGPALRVLSGGCVARTEHSLGGMEAAEKPEGNLQSPGKEGSRNC